VTEDLDLSYRAQLAGWRFRYLDAVIVPSELPVTIASFRCQQKRWAKGSIQTARKVLPVLLRTGLPLSIKLEAIAHLLANVCWLLGLVVTLTLYPTILMRTSIGPRQIIRLDVPLFAFSSAAIFLYFFLYRRRQEKRVPLRVLLALPVFTIGLAPGIALSVIEGFFGRGGVFERTPKFGVEGRGALPVLSFLYRQRSLSYLIMNGFLFCYTLLPVFLALKRNTLLAIPFLLVFPSGFFTVMFKDLMELSLCKNRAA
jgi:cellulose synthase/poly-beta-1,6-N-acetylglucosamine synthase-like glycosyltransferase